jgi:hypothetical protein
MAETIHKDESQRHGFMTHGILRQMPLKAVNVSTINFEVKLRFRRSATTVTNLSDPWNSSCEVSGMLVFLIIH